MDSQMIVGLETLSEQHLDRIMAAIGVYLEFYVSAHPDGKTPSEKAQVSRPEWLTQIAGTERENISEGEKDALIADHMYFGNCKMQRLLNDWICKKPMSERLERISEKIREPGVKELLDENRLNAIGKIRKEMSENDTAITDSKEETLPDSKYDYATVLTPYVTTYEVRMPDKCWARLLSYSERWTMRYLGGIHLVIMEENDLRGASTKSVVMHMLPLSWSRVRVGTRLGTANLTGNQLEVSSTFESRQMALCGLIQEVLGRDLTYLGSNRDVIERSLMRGRR